MKKKRHKIGTFVNQIITKYRTSTFKQKKYFSNNRKGRMTKKIGTEKGIIL